MPASRAIRIVRWSRALGDRFLAAPREAGRVHSVHSRAWNILWHDGGLVTLHGPAPLAAPFAAAAEWLPPAGTVIPGTPVLGLGPQIRLGPFVFDWEGGMAVDTGIRPTEEPPDHLAAALAARPLPAPAPGLCSPAGRRGRHRLAEGVRRRDAAAFVEGACSLIGLGEGLTPAGDDCLVGVLAVLHRFARPWLALHPEIGPPIMAAAEAGTTTVGRDFVRHALEGRVSESIIPLVTAASETRARRAIASLSATGGTSGADTLCGMRLAVEALRE